MLHIGGALEQLTQRNRTNTTDSPGEESSWRTTLRVPYRNITSRMNSGVLRKGLCGWRHSVYGLSTCHVRLLTHKPARPYSHKLRPSRHTHTPARLSTTTELAYLPTTELSRQA